MRNIHKTFHKTFNKKAAEAQSFVVISLVSKREAHTENMAFVI